MAFYKVLQKAIANTDYTQEQIANLCTENGIKRTKSQINKLANGHLKPSEELCRILAKILNEDERLFVIENYLDNAPNEIKEIFQNINFFAYSLSTGLLNNKFTKEIIKELAENVKNEPLSSVAISLLDNSKINVDNINDIIAIISNDNQTILNVRKQGIEIQDNSMEPLLPKGGKVSLTYCEKYNNNDIVMLKLNGEKNYMFRRYFKFGNQIMLFADNKNSTPITKKEEEIKILGKVTELIVKVQ